MPLKGDLASFSLAEIIQSLSLNQSDGTLMVSDGEHRTHLLFTKGQIVPLTRVPLEVSGLDHFFLKHNILTRERLQDLLADGEGALVDRLVERGIAREEDLLPLVRQRMEEEIYDLFLWEEAFFEFKRDEIPEEYRGHLDAYRKVTLGASNILMEAVRRVDEWGRIQSRIPTEKYIFIPREGLEEVPEKAEGAPLKPAEVWPYLDGKHNLAGIQERTGATKFDVFRTVWALLQGWQARPLPAEKLEVAFKEAVRNHDFPLCLTYLEYAMDLGLAGRHEQEKMMIALLSDRVFVASPEEFKLSGNLEDINFADFFLALFLKKHSGTIRVEDSESRKIIYFSPTEIAILSTGAREQLRFGEILVEEGKLTFRELDRALTLSRVHGELLGHVLTREKMISEEDMVFAVRKKIMDEIFDIFLWRNARFEYLKNQTPPEFVENRMVARLALVTGTHLKEILSSFQRFGEISRQISSRAILVRQKRERRESKGVLGTWLGQMGEEEEQGEKDPILDLVDGRRSVGDVIRASKVRGIEICERLYHLLNRGLVRALAGSELRARCERALAENLAEEGLRYCEFALEKGYERAFFAKALEDLKARNPDIKEGSREYKLEGDFESFSPADLFQSLTLNKHSGTLEVSDGSNEKTIMISRGAICLSSRGSREVSRLGDILVDAGKVSEDDVTRALEVQKGSGKKIGEILVEEGRVSEEDIQEAIREKIKEELFDIFLWENAHFTFTKNYFPEDLTDPQSRATRMELDTTRILMTAVNRIQEWSRIEEKFKTTKAVFYLPDADAISSKNLSRKERAILSLVDGRNNLEDVIEKSGVGRFRTCQVLFEFFQKGWALPMDLERLNREAEEAFERHEFELCVKFYEYAIRLDQDNPDLVLALEMARGTLPKKITEKKIRIKGVDLNALFTNLIRERRSGTLTARDSKSRCFLYLAPDEVLLLTEGARRGPTVEESLVAKGQLTEKALARARERQQQLGTDLASVLEKQGVISYNEVEKLRKKKVFEEIESLFHWPDASIEFDPHHLPRVLEDPANDVLCIRMNVWEMLETITDRIAEWQRIRKIVPSEDLVFVAAPPEEREGRVLHPLGEKILDRADGNTPLRALFEELGGDWFEAWRALKRLMDARVMRPLTVEEADRQAQNALVFNEFANAKALLRHVLVLQPGNAGARKKLELLKSRTQAIERGKTATVLREVRLADVLKTVADQGRAGTLTAEREDGSCTIYVSSERLLLLTSGSVRGPYLGEILEECLFARKDQVEKGLQFQQRTRKRLGEILVLQGVLKEEQLKYALREKVLLILHDLFRWEGARFRFADGTLPEALTAPDVPVTDIAADGHLVLRDALERETLWAEIAGHIPSGKAIFLSLDADVRRKGNAAKANPILDLVNGKRTVEDILAKVPGTNFHALRDLSRLARAQVIRTLTVEEAKKGGNEAYMFNEFQTAIRLYEWTLELNPEDQRVRNNLERAQSFLGGQS